MSRYKGRQSAEGNRASRRLDELRRLLRLVPGDISPLDVTADEPWAYPQGTAGAKSWPKAVALRAELAQAAGQKI